MKNLTNFLLICLVVVIAAYVVYMYIRKLKKLAEKDTGNFENIFAIDYLTNAIKRSFSEIQRQNINDMDLDEEEYNLRKSLKKELVENTQNATSGDKEAKKFLKTFIKDLLQADFGINKFTINKIIPFDNYNLLRADDRFAITLYLYNQMYGAEGMAKIIALNELDKPKKDRFGYDKYAIDKDDIKEVFEKLISKHIKLTYDDKLEIVTQIIFSKGWGFGPIDELIDSTIDEIEGGVSGIPDDTFNIEQGQLKNVEYSHDSIWITYKALNIQLKCISFGSAKELRRITKNVGKYNAPTVLSRKSGKVIATMRNGSRVAAMRPPFADEFCFCIRKFDSAPSVDPDALLTDEDSLIPILWTKWLIRGQRTMIVSGPQGSGKSTWLKSAVRFIPNKYNIRLQEMQAELNLRFAYPEKNIIAFQETPDIPSQEALNFQKKTNGMVNIVGEIASAIAATWLVQTSKVASLFGLGTHHANTGEDLVTSFRDNLKQTGFCSDDKTAEMMAAKILNINEHMTKNEDTKHRYMERITEIIPIDDRGYQEADVTDENLDKVVAIHTMEYQHRMTDRKLFDTSNLCEWHNYKYYATNLPSPDLMIALEKTIDIQDREEFSKDMVFIKAKHQEYLDAYEAGNFVV